MTASLDACPWCSTNEHLSFQRTGSMTADMPDRPCRVVCTHIDHDTVVGPTAYGKPAAITAWNTRTQQTARSADIAQRLQDYMEQHHGVCLSASEWDAVATFAARSADVGREAIEAVFAAWDKHCAANERTNAAIPPISSTPAERAVYDERYRASEEARREWIIAMHVFVNDPTARAALTTPPADDGN